MMQILDVVIYSHHGDMRKISFDPKKVNLIIGPDNSGKSSVGKIIEYCLGSEFEIPEGDMDTKVSWYGIRMQLGNLEYFIARKHKNIPPQHLSMFYQIGKSIEIPQQISQPMTSQKTIIGRISEQMGIMPGIEIPWPSYENPTEADVTNTLPFCFQYQSEIQSEYFLFHRYVGEFTRTITKHILPYFLGAIPDKKVKQRYQLIKIDKEIKALQKQLDELIIMKTGGNRLTNSLILESKKLGMFSDDEIQNYGKEIKNILKAIANWSPSKTRSDFTNDLTSLQDKSIELREQLNELDKQIDVVTRFRDDYVDYETRIKHQQSHLKPIDLFSKLNGESKKCPLCSNYLESESDITTAIKRSISELTKQLDDVHLQTHNTNSILEKLESTREILHGKIISNYNEIDILVNQDKKNKQLFDDDMNRARLSAKAEFWLDIVNKENDIDLQQEISEKEFLKHEIEKEVDLDLIYRKSEQIHNYLNQFINEKTKMMNLAIRNKFVGFDTERQTFWYDDDGQKSKLRMGGESWLGLHIITMAGFHKYFNKNNRPVPNFLFLDQPSQVYYSSEIDDYDSNKTNALYNFIFSLESEGFVQMIITDHAKLKTKLFSNRIKKTFTESEKFVPKNWPNIDGSH